jgi:hypothetical protein
LQIISLLKDLYRLRHSFGPGRSWVSGYSRK